MEKILEYIMLNYTWILGTSIIILLAVIGYYADKTNFGQGKNKEQKTNDDKLNIEENNEEQISEDFDKEFAENKVEDIKTEEQIPNNLDTINQLEIPEVNSEENNSEISFEQTFEKFDKEFNEILPEKELIDDELLDEIDSLSLDKTQKIDLNDIPDLDDVELPKIKELQPEEEDIWKF